MCHRKCAPLSNRSHTVSHSRYHLTYMGHCHSTTSNGLSVTVDSGIHHRWVVVIVRERGSHLVRKTYSLRIDCLTGSNGAFMGCHFQLVIGPQETQRKSLA